MTVSRDIAHDVISAHADHAARARAFAALGELSPREAPDAASTRPVVPAPPLRSDEATATWLRRSVAAVRRAIEDGSLHHHDDAPAGRRTPAVEVVRAWAAGHGVDGQRRHCHTCAADEG